MSQDREFENKIKEMLDGHTIEPAPLLWNNIQSKIQGNERRKVFGWWFFVVPVVLGTALGLSASFLTPKYFSSTETKTILADNQIGNADLQKATESQSSTLLANASNSTASIHSEAVNGVNEVNNSEKSEFLNTPTANSSLVQKSSNAKVLSNSKNKIQNEAAYSNEEPIPTKKAVKKSARKLFIAKLFGKRKTRNSSAKKQHVPANSITDHTESTTEVEYTNSQSLLAAQDSAHTNQAENTVVALAKKVQTIADTAQTVKSLTAAVSQVAKDENIKHKLGLEVFFNARTTFNRITLGNSASEYGTNGKESNSLNNRLSYEVGLRLSKNIAPHLVVFGAVSMSLINSGFSYQANNYVARQTPVLQGSSANGMQYTTTSPYTIRNISVSSMFLGLQLGTYLYPTSTKNFRFGGNVGYYSALNNNIEITENNESKTTSNKQGTIGLGISAGYSFTINSDTRLWIEPNAQLFLRKSSTMDGIANFQPHTIGINFIFQRIH